MRERKSRPNRYRPGTEHWRHADCDHRPAQVYAQAMAAVQAQKLSGVTAILARLTGPRRPRG